ncbi:hypothetical protein [Thioalkalivibrio thiocyanoxidans]|uniref:hypothetical protein n=1 Tax=Thioalkalivibrio thiocyanoxidans TaxID=152475 RepID=UPI003CC6B550
MSFLFVWAALFSLIILGSRRRAGLGARMSYAGLTLLAPFVVFFLGALGVWYAPEGVPRWLEMTLAFYLPLVTPYMVRALFVFRRPVYA